MNYRNALVIKNISVGIKEREIVKNISLTIPAGQVHVIMGPNGSGKSTLVYGLMGHPNYEVSFGDTQDKRREKLEVRSKNKKENQGGIFLDGEDIIELLPEERAKKGLMLAFQHPITIPGVSISNFLRTAYRELHGKDKKTLVEFHTFMKEKAKELSLDEGFLRRSLNDGFSGGEKKKVEMFQLLVLQPRYTMFDEIDTGLDIDALKAVAVGISALKKQGVGILIITHYQRILKYLTVDQVHVMLQGTIVAHGGGDLIDQIEKGGYAQL